MPNFFLIAHRGASGNYPENSLLAFRKALEAGVTWLELDVHLSADGELVVIHDATLERTTGGQGHVAQQTWSDLQRLDIGRGEKLPRLAEVLDLAKGRATVNIELKGAGVATSVTELLTEREKSHQSAADEILASSLNESELILFAEQMPHIRVAPVADWPDSQTLALAKRLNAWSINVAKASVQRDLIDQVKRQEQKLLVYTVNDPTEVQQLKALGIEGVFTDYPERLIDQQKKSFRGR